MNPPNDPMDVLELMRPPAADSTTLLRIRGSIDEAIRRAPAPDSDRLGHGHRRGRPGRAFRPSGWGRGTRPALLVGAVAALAAGAVLVSPALTPTSAEAATPPLLRYTTATAEDVAAGQAPSGTEIAADLAATAARQETLERTSDVSVVESAYWSLEAVHEQDETRLVVKPVERTVWASAVDGSMRFREVEGTALSTDGSTPLPHVEFTGPTLIDYTLPADHDRGALQPDLLPRDPERLLEAVSHARDPHACDLATSVDRMNCLADALISMVRSGPVPPDLMSAFWSALAAEDEVSTLGNTTDRLGRPGVSLAYPAAGEGVAVLIADPDTGALLGSEGIDTTGAVTGKDTPAVFWLEAFQSPRWVEGFDDV